jgi:S-adenosyl-L-methionine hydrolase (adenosine-forming)
MAAGIVTFTSDYGWEDEFVGVCHGVMLSIYRELRIVDLHHSIARHDVRHGAVVLEQSVPYMPDAVHLAVVDPSVGSARRAIAVETTWGAVFVGPDNGLLVPAADACGGISAAYSLEDERFLLSPVSRTFQGRDVFAPASAHLASGVPAAELGPPAEISSLAQLEIPEAWEHDDHLHAEVLQVDRFGNLQLNFDGVRLKEIGLSDSSSLEVRLEGHRLQVHHGATFADVPSGDFVLVEDSYKHLSLAINKGDARAKLRAAAGSTVIVGPIST